MKEYDKSLIGKMLNLEIGRCYEIRDLAYRECKPKIYYIRDKTVHCDHEYANHSYFALTPGNSDMSCDYGGYIWDQGMCYWHEETGNMPLLSGHFCIITCRKLNDKENEEFIKRLRGNYS